MQYRLLAADLDGTLVDETTVFTARVKEAVRRVQEKGVHFTIATGRTFQATLPFARELAVLSPLICHQGGLIKDPLSGQVLFRRAIPLPLAREVIGFAEKKDLALTLFLDDEAYVSQLRPEAEEFIRLNSPPLQPVGDLEAFLNEEPTKFMILCPDGEATERLLPEVQNLFAPKMKVVRSHPNFIELTPPDVSKGAALAWLAAYLGVSREETMAIGDQDNDVEMLAWAGLGVAMGNATNAVLAAADYVAPPIWEDGAAFAIEKFILM